MGLSYRLTEPIGSAATLGLIVLQSDETIEAEFRAIFPQEDVATYVSRVPSAPHVTADTLAEMEAELPRAAGLLPPSLAFDAVGYGCTSGATVIGPEAVHGLIRGAVKTRAVTEPLSAVRAAIGALGVRRIGVVSPYIAEVSAPLIAALEAAGVTVTASVSFDERQEARVARIDPASSLEAGLEIGASEDVEAVFLSCTNLRTVGILDSLEARLGKPAISSNQALAWHMASLAGVKLGRPVGRLMRA